MIILRLTEQVEQILKKYPETRNSDIDLTIKLWKIYYPNKIHYGTVKGIPVIRLKDLFELPREDNIKRIRAKIQNQEFRYLPTYIEVVRRRRMDEDSWREALGSNNY